MKPIYLVIFLLTLISTACGPTPTTSQIRVTIIVDGRTQSYGYDEPIPVGQFLDEINIELGELDRVNPPQYTQISDEMLIQVVRVQETEECRDETIPFEERRVYDESVNPGEEFLVKKGVNGTQRLCFRTEIVDGVSGTPVQIGQPVVITPAQEELIYIAPPTSLDPVEIVGTLAYISKGNAWVMRGSSQPPNRRAITNSGDLDGRVFSLSFDGRQLLMSREIDPSGDFNNELWLLPDVHAPEPRPIKLRPSNLLYADWVPGRPNTIAYSRAEPRATSPGWKALNDLRLSIIDPQTGEEIDVEPLLDENAGGPYGWWGTKFSWSPDGQRLAWVQADAVGLLDLQSKEFQPLVTYSIFTPYSDWSWTTSVSWSPDSQLLATTVHGPPISTEAPERSPVFNIAVLSVEASFSAEIVTRAGIWSSPKFSPQVEPNDGLYPQVYLAYLLARQPLDSVSDTAEYDLYVADRDGSNARRIFPQDGQRGILTRDYVWSPDGRQIALVYQGNLWIVDVITGNARQITLDGNVSNPVWTR
ncbi:MAG: DPP IV N-terminal domain-containing protein [Anaerolineae bacterium]|nr:DPP IV N-terminal domain-containing protein [Anaerolineae bacterium]